MENINWLKEFENIDIDKAIKLELYKTKTTDEKKNRVFEAAYNLTLQYLQAFKKETYLLSDSRKLEYIRSLNIEKPKPQATANNLSNMATFEAQSNYFHFLNDYMDALTKCLQHQQTENEQTKQKRQIKAIYKKHPTNIDLTRIPIPILNKYFIICEYRYLNVSGFGEIPFPLFAILGVENNKIDISTLPLKEYAKGFIEGYNTNLIPFIDTTDTRKEVILKESVFKGGKGFTENRSLKGIEYKNETMFESGLFEGKRYKAWEIIFETPAAFVQYFEPQQTESNQEQAKTEISQTKKDILELFETIDTKLGWKYAFRNKPDYYTFIDLLTFYFDGKPYSLPQQVINLNRNCKTRFAKHLNSIYYNKSEAKKKLNSDIEFFNIIRILNHFKDLNDHQIYKSIIR